MSTTRQLRNQLRGILGAKADLQYAIPALMGDSSGTVDVPGTVDRVYVRVENITVEAYCAPGIPRAPHLEVLVGYDYVQPKLFKVLSERIGSGQTRTLVNVLATHHQQHEWQGADVVYSELRQFLPWLFYPSDDWEITVKPGAGWLGASFVEVAEQTIDLEAEQVLNSGMAKLVMLYLDDAGAVHAEAGAEVAAASLAPADMPDVPAAAAMVLGAVRMYEGQTAIAEAKTGTDIWDLRYPYWHTHGASTGGASIAFDYSEANVSNPPTEAELIAAFGAPSTDQQGQGYIVNDAGASNNLYLCLPSGGRWWLTPLTRAVLATPSVTVTSTATIASAAGQWFGRAAVKVLDGVVVLAYYEATHHAANDGELHIRFSDDYGATWSDEDEYLDGSAVTGFPMNPPDADAGEDAGEPWLMIAPNGDLLLHMWRVDYGVTANGSYQSRSTDGGRTWSTPAAIAFEGTTADLLIFSTDDDFIYNGVLYAGAREYDDATPTNCKNILIKTEDNGTTWTKVSDISNFTTDTIEVGLEYLGNSTIIAVLRDLNNTYTYKTTSADMGATWAALTDVTATLEASGRHRIYTRSHLRGGENWWQDPVLIMVGFQLMSPGSSQQRRNCIWISQDAGATWTGPEYLDDQSEDAGYGDVFYDPDNNRYVVINYQGALAEATLEQYNLTIGGI